MNETPVAPETAEPPAERKFTIGELAAELRISNEKARRIFDLEEGVLRIGHGATRKRRRYFTLRVPASVRARVLERLAVQR
jgi:hypothetical protein